MVLRCPHLFRGLPSSSSRARRAAGLFLTALACASIAPDAAAKNDDIKIFQFLSSTGADPDGTARARWRDKGGGEFDFSVELEQMNAGDYTLAVAGADKGTIEVDGSGEGELEFKTPQDGPKPLFDFEVFGQLITVRQGETVFFSDIFVGAGGGGPGGGDKTKTEIALVNVGPDSDAKGKLRYETKGGKLKFKVEIEKLPAATWTLRVGGEPVGELVTVSSASVEVEYSDPVEAGKTLLAFDPLGKLVEIERDGTIYLAAFLPGSDTSTGGKSPNTVKQTAKDLGKAKADKLLIVLANTGAVAGAKGKATLAQGSETEFEVEVEKLPAGEYELYVGDVLRGALTVTSGSAELHFSTSPGAGESLLDFAVKSQLIEIRDGDSNVLLAAVFPLSVQAALNKFVPEFIKPNKLRLNMANVGVDLDATGLLLGRETKAGVGIIDLRVRDLPDGNYVIEADNGDTVQTSASELVVKKGKGRLVFSTEPKGKQVQFDFDALGKDLRLVGPDDEVYLLVAFPAL